MPPRYSTYEAKARFSEILRQVRAGQHVTITYRGLAVAEVRPIYGVEGTEATLLDLEERGIVAGAAAPTGPLAPLAKRPGAVERFLGSRE